MNVKALLMGALCLGVWGQVYGSAMQAEKSEDLVRNYFFPNDPVGSQIEQDYGDTPAPEKIETQREDGAYIIGGEKYKAYVVPPRFSLVAKNEQDFLAGLRAGKSWDVPEGDTQAMFINTTGGNVHDVNPYMNTTIFGKSGFSLKTLGNKKYVSRGQNFFFVDPSGVQSQALPFSVGYASYYTIEDFQRDVAIGLQEDESAFFFMNHHKEGPLICFVKAGI